MSRPFSPLIKEILDTIEKNPGIMLHDFYSAHKNKENHKGLYNCLFRLKEQELVREEGKKLYITDSGLQVIHKLNPTLDGVWKIVIFDIPEKNRYIRTVLRSKLGSLGFKKWQNSIWISPFALDPTIEAEFTELAKHHFIRLIKTTDINETKDLKKLFDID